MKHNDPPELRTCSKPSNLTFTGDTKFAGVNGQNSKLKP